MGTLAPTRGRLPVQPSKTTRTGTSGKIVHHCVRAMFIGHFAVGFAAKRSAGAWPQRQDGSRPVESGGGNGGHRGRHARGRGNLVRRRDKICDARRQPGILGISRAAGLLYAGAVHGDPLPNVTVLALSALSGWLAVWWAAWFDGNRVPRREAIRWMDPSAAPGRVKPRVDGKQFAGRAPSRRQLRCRGNILATGPSPGTQGAGRSGAHAGCVP